MLDYDLDTGSYHQSMPRSQFKNVFRDCNLLQVTWMGMILHTIVHDPGVIVAFNLTSDVVFELLKNYIHY